MEKILLVEDSRPTIDLINTTLTEKGYKVAFALNGTEAITTAKKWQPALILMDILMPEMDGYETCTNLKLNEQTKQIPIIFLSALTQTFDKVKAFQVGGVDYLSKPIEIDELLVRIKTHLTISRLQKELLDANEKLEEKVKIRTAELNETNIQLQSSILELFAKKADLEDSEKRYRMLVDSIMYPVLVTNIKGDFLYINKRAAEFFGINPENIQNLNSSQFWIKAAKRKDFIEELKLNGNVNNMEIGFKNFDNNTITAVISSSTINYYGQPAILTVYNDITKQKQLEQQILTTTIETEERERKSFAQELHDGLGPLLSAAKMYLQWINQTEDKADIPNLLNKTQALVDEAHKTSREISHNLSPHILQNFGFVAALKNFVEQTKLSKTLSVKINDNADNLKSCFKQLGVQKETILYRVITESINNTLKHAQASEIDISIQLNNDILEIIYGDNGIGFDTDRTLSHTIGLGLFNMKYRIEAINGIFTLRSKPGEGTKIKIQLEI